MSSFQRLNTLVGWAVFAVAAMVYILTAEPTTSLWDCGEFISAADKLQVVHPPGAPLFLMVGRMFAFLAETFSSDPSTVAYAVNIMSGLSTAFLVLFIFWSTTMLAKLSLVGRKGEVEGSGQTWAILGAGIVAGLATTFCTSVWFSAVEGEVYAMSSGFTGLVIWAGLKWYVSDRADADRWLVFIAYMAGLSIGVHLLSLLVIPFVAMLYAYKQYQQKQDNEEAANNTVPIKHTVLGFLAGFAVLMVVQAMIIPKIPQLAASFDFFFVNSLGMGMGTGMLAFIFLLVGGVVGLLYLAHKRQHYLMQLATMCFLMILLGFSTYTTIVIRASANTPINMNNPSDPYSLLSYINREQYGDRPLLFGPHYGSEPIGYNKLGFQYRPVASESGKIKYEKVGEKFEYKYSDKDLMFFPRLGHFDRKGQYMGWLGMKTARKPTFGDNISFFFNYQISWMYVRYFMWNFVGRQNAKQGFASANVMEGNWISGISFIDNLRLHPQGDLPKVMAEEKSRNTYYFLPLIFGFIGLFFHINRRPQEAVALGALFLMTGLAIIVFSNQPPSEPRERDYVLVGSFFTFCIWIGLAVPALYERLKEKMSPSAAGGLALGLAITAPLIMGYQNWDDHSRAAHYAARDYAINFLESCAPNAIIFTYGDNDTYPLWYAQEVENIRPDVRVINFSLLAVDWYIDQLRRKVNESPMVQMTLPPAAYRGDKRNMVPVLPSPGNKPVDMLEAIKFLAQDKTPPIQGGENYVGYLPSRIFSLPVNVENARKMGALPANVPDSLIPTSIVVNMNKDRILKDDMVLWDIIATNAARGWERPIYFAVTVRPDKLAGFSEYLQLEGMAVRLTPIRGQGDPRFGGSMFASRLNTEIAYKNIMEKFRWGNFDKENLFVDESYGPSIQSIQFAMLRLADELINENKKEQAVKVVDKFFEAFPDMNFPHHSSRAVPQALGLYFAVGEEGKARPIIENMANSLVEHQNFYQSLPASLAQDPGSGIKDQAEDNLRTMMQLLQIVQTGKDEELKKKLQTLFAEFGVALPQQQPRQPLDSPKKDS